jgi:hypothetical protein
MRHVRATIVYPSGLLTGTIIALSAFVQPDSSLAYFLLFLLPEFLPALKSPQI